MEDAVDALKMSASVMAFVIALAIVFSMFSQARAVSDYVLNRTDNTFYDTYIDPNESYTGEGRIVGLETVIPTLYRYYREKYYIAVKNGENVKEIFDEEIERSVYRGVDIEDRINNLNPSYVADLYKQTNNKGREEIFISWLANPNIDTQKRVTDYVSGEKDAVNGKELKKYDNHGLWTPATRNDTFLETHKLTENGSKLYTGEDGSIVYIIKGTKKVNLTYTKQ